MRDLSTTSARRFLRTQTAASPRILIPILENYQNADGSVTGPEVLRGVRMSGNKSPLRHNYFGDHGIMISI
jgi:seryl-tRNA synthetase